MDVKNIVMMKCLMVNIILPVEIQCKSLMKMCECRV